MNDRHRTVNRWRKKHPTKMAKDIRFLIEYFGNITDALRAMYFLFGDADAKTSIKKTVEMIKGNSEELARYEKYLKMWI